MASLKFYLTRPESKKSGIFFLLSYGAFETVNGKKRYLPLKYYVDESIETAYWGQGKAKETRLFPQYPEFNTRLRDIENIALNVLRKMQNDKVGITEKTLRDELDKIFKGVKDLTPDETTEVTTFADNFIKNSKRKAGTINNYKLTLKNLIEFEEKSEKKLKFMEIDMEFYKDFLDFLIEKDYAPNTQGTRIKNLKVFLSEALMMKIPVCLDFKINKKFGKPSEDVNSVYLNESELQQMYHLDLKANPLMERTRDLFLIGACTGFRYSDYSTLRIENICLDGIIRKRTIKTEQDVAIPVHPIVRSILKKYGNEIPRVPYAAFNKTIKEVVREARIDYMVTYSETKGTVSEVKIEPKWKLVASHTARRSFATNAYLSGIPSISIMKMTGHKKESSFLKYIKITLSENAKILQLHRFFTQEPESEEKLQKQIAG